ncbi:MAG: cupredoxin domain-containing protein [Roseiflexus sp.]|nr:cupredoxin domain-containing protein [Roseiflexus sp.]MCS7288700.1 cupredoxin domain-containing protein [Roseiflexus sp.]MDW8147244.1 cupredoxin domain-containing protein [Roseiflexaceae bacterium]
MPTTPPTTAPTLAPPIVALTPAPTAESGAIAVDIIGFVYEPNPVVIRVGTTVIWTNRDTTVHTVTAEDASFESGLLTLGATFRFTFTQPGEFSYICTRHPAMVGIVQVTP